MPSIGWFLNWVINWPTGYLVGVAPLERVQMAREEGQALPQEVAQHGHVNGETAQVVGVIALGQNAFNQVDHHLHPSHAIHEITKNETSTSG